MVGSFSALILGPWILRKICVQALHVQWRGDAPARSAVSKPMRRPQKHGFTKNLSNSDSIPQTRTYKWWGLYSRGLAMRVFNALPPPPWKNFWLRPCSTGNRTVLPYSSFWPKRDHQPIFFQVPTTCRKGSVMQHSLCWSRMKTFCLSLHTCHMQFGTLENNWQTTHLAISKCSVNGWCSEVIQYSIKTLNSGYPALWPLELANVGCNML